MTDANSGVVRAASMWHCHFVLPSQGADGSVGTYIVDSTTGVLPAYFNDVSKG